MTRTGLAAIAPSSLQVAWGELCRHSCESDESCSRIQGAVPGPRCYCSLAFSVRLGIHVHCSDFGQCTPAWEHRCVFDFQLPTVSYHLQSWILRHTSTWDDCPSDMDQIQPQSTQTEFARLLRCAKSRVAGAAGGGLSPDCHQRQQFRFATDPPFSLALRT